MICLILCLILMRKAFRKLEHLRRVTSEAWDAAGIDVLVVPTASITPTVQEVLEVPVGEAEYISVSCLILPAAQ